MYVYMCVYVCVCRVYVCMYVCWGAVEETKDGDAPFDETTTKKGCAGVDQMHACVLVCVCIMSVCVCVYVCLCLYEHMLV